MSTRGDVVAVTCLALEARIALGPGVSVICTHASKLVAALERAAKRGASGIISFGIAGGLAPDLAAGDWVVGSGVRTEEECFPTDRAWARALLAALPGAVHAEIIGADAPVALPTEKRRLHAQTGAVAVDNESHVAASGRRLPDSVCRLSRGHRSRTQRASAGRRHRLAARRHGGCSRCISLGPQALLRLAAQGRLRGLVRRSTARSRRWCRWRSARPRGATPSARCSTTARCPSFAATRWIAPAGMGPRRSRSTARRRSPTSTRRASWPASAPAFLTLALWRACCFSLWRQGQRATLLRDQMKQERAIFNLKGYAEKIVASVPSGLLLLSADSASALGQPLLPRILLPAPRRSHGAQASRSSCAPRASSAGRAR